LSDRENICSEYSDIVGATCRSPADVNRKSDAGELPLAPTAFIFVDYRVRHQVLEGCSEKAGAALMF
jgi:hypothetical protein